MGLIDRMLEKRLTKLMDERVRSIGSEFYQGILKNVQNQPVYMNDNIEAYINQGYLFNPIVYSIVSFIAQKAGSIPWAVYQVKNDKALNLYKSASPNLSHWKKEAVKVKALVEMPDHDINHLFMSPNIIQSWSEFIEQIVGFKLVTGNSYIHLIGPSAGINKGKIQEMWTLPSQAVAIVAGNRMEPVKRYILKGQRDIDIPAEEIIHLRYWTPKYSNGQFLYGMSPIQAGRRVVTKSNASYDSMVSSFQNMGAVGVLSPEGAIEEFTQEQQDKLERVFARKTGSNNRGKPLIVDTPVKWQQIGMSPADLSIIESDNMDLRTICNLFHVPSELFNDPANKTYSNTKEAGTAVYTNAVIPALNQFRDAFNQHIKVAYPNIYIDFDTTMISELQDDITEMTSALQNAWWLSPNERRDMMTFGVDSDSPEMNDYFIPAGLMPLNSTRISDDDLQAAINAIDDDK